MEDGYKCPYCDKSCRSARGVTQHVNQTPACLADQKRQVSSITSQRDRLEARRLDALQQSFASQHRRSLRLEQASVVPVLGRPASGLKCPPEVADQDAAAGFPDAESLESEGKGDANQAPKRSNLPRKRPAETSISDDESGSCLLYTSPSPRDLSTSRMPSSA